MDDPEGFGTPCGPKSFGIMARVAQMRTTISRIRAGMSRAARARRLHVLVRGSAQPVAATAVVPEAACAAGTAVGPAVSGVPSAQRA